MRDNISKILLIIVVLNNSCFAGIISLLCFCILIFENISKFEMIVCILGGVFLLLLCIFFLVLSIFLAIKFKREKKGNEKE